MKDRILTLIVLGVFAVSVNLVSADDQKISQLSELTSPDDNDLMVVVDVSDTTMAATGTNKKITWVNIEAAIDITNLDGYSANEHIDWTVDQSPTTIHANNIDNINASLITSGTVVHERGGLEADVSGYTGLVAISGGATSEVDSKSELEAQIADVSDFAMADGDTYTGTHDFTSATITGMSISAASITSGTVAHERGGLEADVSGYEGLIGISSGATVEVDTLAELETLIGGADICEKDGSVYTNIHNFTGATLLVPALDLIVSTYDSYCTSDACNSGGDNTSVYLVSEGDDDADVVALGVGSCTQAGLRKRFMLKTRTSAGDSVEVTPTGFRNGTKFTLDNAGESVTLECDGAAWFIIGSYEDGSAGLS